MLCEALGVTGGGGMALLGPPTNLYKGMTWGVALVLRIVLFDVFVLCLFIFFKHIYVFMFFENVRFSYFIQ
jgi:hypothetical protein